MLFHSLDLTRVRWEAKHIDGKIIKKGNRTYETIDRDNLESFSLTYRNKPILTVIPKENTLVQRLKTWNQSFILSGKTENRVRTWIVAVLAKPQSKETTQHVVCDFDPKWDLQHYYIDSKQSSICYLTENGKTQINTKFGNISPFTPLHLRAEEFKQLMGLDDPAKMKNDN